MRRRPSRWHGLLPIAKESGPTSHDVVDMARKALGERRIGHTGTLDPSAEGLLILCVGQATRLQQYLLGWDKTYNGRIRLGRSTTTYDTEGETIEPSGEVPALDGARLRELEQRFSGAIEQVPPPFSAKKVGGKKLYELARSGQEVRVEPKKVTVHELRLNLEAADLLSFEVRTSSGFYVRSLAHDFGVRVGCGAHLEHLQRVRIGPYRLEDALPQQDLVRASSPQQILDAPAWTALSEVRLPFSAVELNSTAGERFVHGGEVIVLRHGHAEVRTGDLVAVHGRAGRLLGIGLVTSVLARGRTIALRPRMVLEGGNP